MKKNKYSFYSVFGQCRFGARQGMWPIRRCSKGSFFNYEWKQQQHLFTTCTTVQFLFINKLQKLEN